MARIDFESSTCTADAFWSDFRNSWRGILKDENNVTVWLCEHWKHTERWQAIECAAFAAHLRNEGSEYVPNL